MPVGVFAYRKDLIPYMLGRDVGSVVEHRLHMQEILKLNSQRLQFKVLRWKVVSKGLA